MYTSLLVDIGGVLLTDGWNTASRRKAADTFGLDWDETERLHRLADGAWELGKISRDEYLSHVIFNRPREFSREDYVRFMEAESAAHVDVIEYVGQLKHRHGLRVGAVSNESRELSEYRTRQFRLLDVVDFLIVSGAVHYRKPDRDIYRLALDAAGATPGECVYLENTDMFAQVAREMGIAAILHDDLAKTQAALAELGLD